MMFWLSEIWNCTTNKGTFNEEIALEILTKCIDVDCVVIFLMFYGIKVDIVDDNKIESVLAKMALKTGLTQQTKMFSYYSRHVSGTMNENDEISVGLCASLTFHE